MAASILGLILIALGVVNIRGNISTIHWYNRRKVSEEDIPKYGKAVGTGTVVIGSTLLVVSILEAFSGESAVQLLIPLGLIPGIAQILYAQFKYNHGLF